MKFYLSFDNGVSGSLTVMDGEGKAKFVQIPVKKELDYTKAKKYLNRIDHKKLYAFILNEIGAADKSDRILALIERPMVNPRRWQASVSAIRADESVKCLLENLEIPYMYLDSKEWQKEMLPSGLEKEELKTASLSVGTRLFPHIQSKHKDRDSLLMAEYARRKGL